MAVFQAAEAAVPIVNQLLPDKSVKSFEDPQVALQPFNFTFTSIAWKYVYQ